MAKNKGRPVAAPPTATELVATLRDIANRVEANGVSTMTAYELTKAVRVSMVLAEARLRAPRE